MVIGTGFCTRGTDDGIVDKKRITSTIADHTDVGALAILVGQQIAKDVLGTQPFQCDPDLAEFAAHYGGGALSSGTDVIKTLVVVTGGLTGPELSRPSVQTDKQVFVFFHGDAFE